ncbi:hypothetical protein [Micromonospora marina]
MVAEGVVDDAIHEGTRPLARVHLLGGEPEGGAAQQVSHGFPLGRVT